MEREISIKEVKYIIMGNWTLQGLSYAFNGHVEESVNKKTVLEIDFKVPLSAIRKFGHDAMNDEIEISVKEHLEKNA